MRQIWETPGGIHPEQNKHQSTQQSIGTIDIPPEIILPLGQHIGAQAVPIVNVGDYVLKGQQVAKPEGLFSAGIHASTSGTVSAIEDRTITHPSGMSAPCIIITPDGLDKWVSLSPCDDYLTQDRHQLLERIRNAGIVGMGGAGFPTAIKVNPKSNRHVTTLIINGTECEPYITADDMLMRERAYDILLGAQLLSYLLGEIEDILIGIEDNKPEAIDAMEKAAKELGDNKIHVVSFPTKYPSGGEKQLIQILTGKEVPSGGLPAQLGIVVQNVGTALAAYRAIKFGEPLISRVTTVVGESLKIQRNIDVLIGTPLSFVLEQHGFEEGDHQRLIIGGPMMGFAAQNQSVPVIKTTNCILAPTAKELPLPKHAQACIRCAMCADACPASLLPQQLYWFSRSEDFEKLEQHNLFDCIECGACSYVCPSNIPLVQYYRASKGAIRQHREEKEKSDRSRVRFEQRQARIEQAEAEKEAKREARKKAALEAKKLMSEKSDNVLNTSLPNDAKGHSNAATATADPAVKKAKLERALSSAQSRLDRARSQLQSNIDEDNGSRHDTLQAKIKQAELKVQDAQKKLDELDTKPSSSSQNQSTTTRSNTKPSLSWHDKQKADIKSLEKRISVARQKHSEAQRDNSQALSALALGIEKLELKLTQAKNELAQSSQETAVCCDEQAQEGNTALSAIEKAKAKAELRANMSDAEKKQEQIKTLTARVEKAKSRLEKAQAEKDDNIGAFENAYTKLKSKLDNINTN